MDTVGLLIMIILWAVAAAQLTALLVRAWSRRHGTRSRLAGALVALDAAVLLAVVRALAPPPGAAITGWAVAAALFGIGVAGLVLRWRRLPWLAPRRADRPSRGRSGRVGGVVAAGVHLAVGAAVIMVLA